jgi:hypothetical protein
MPDSEYQPETVALWVARFWRLIIPTAVLIGIFVGVLLDRSGLSLLPTRSYTASTHSLDIQAKTIADLAHNQEMLRALELSSSSQAAQIENASAELNAAKQGSEIVKLQLAGLDNKINQSQRIAKALSAQQGQFAETASVTAIREFLSSAMGDVSNVKAAQERNTEKLATAEKLISLPEGARAVIKVFYGTDRNSAGEAEKESQYGSGRAVIGFGMAFARLVFRKTIGWEN